MQQSFLQVSLEPERPLCAADALAQCVHRQNCVQRTVHVPLLCRYCSMHDWMLPCTLRFQDGAATANNPAALAMAEARALWPDTPVDVLVS